MTRGTTTSVTVRHLVDWLEAGGEDLRDWRQAAGVGDGALASPDLRVPLDAFDALWARATARDPSIGLRLIDHFPPGQMHLVTHLALRAPTIGDAVRDVERFMALTDPLDRIACTVEAGVAVLRYRHPGLEDGSRRNPGFVEHLLAMAHVLFGRGAGRALPLRDVRFAGPRLAEDDDYRARFGRVPGFHAGVNELHYDATVLDWPLATRDDYLRGLLGRLAAERLPPASPASWSERLSELLRRRWLDGQALDLAGAAAALGLAPGALRARLAAEGAGFRSLADTTRREVARIHLGGPMSIGEIAYLLGFSEPAAFQHAVRRWFGASAGEVRARIAAGDQGEASSRR